MDQLKASYSNNFDFFRRILSMMSPSVLVVMVLSFTAFRVEEKYTSEHWAYYSLMVAIVGYLAVILFVIWDDLDAYKKTFNQGYLIFNFIIACFFTFVAILLLIYGVYSAGSLYSSLTIAK